MSLVALALAAQLSAPLLAFPEPGVDDTAAYRGYQTRLYRDVDRNTLQVYLDQREGRVVHLLADGDDASIGFSLRAPGRAAPVAIAWAEGDAEFSRAGRERRMQYALTLGAARVELGAFLLGSMRVERDFQYWKRHRAPFTAPPFRLDEDQRLLQALARLAPATRRAHLDLLGAPSIAALRARLVPTVRSTRSATSWAAIITQPSPDARDTMRLELSVDPGRVLATQAGGRLTLAARTGNAITITVRLATTGPTLTPLARDEIFTAGFLDFLATAPRDAAAQARAAWLERQARGVELLSSREKLMAGLPTYATYFGRDMLVSALMMRGIWRPEMSAFAIAAALRKLSPDGEVSHEEALGGQASRESFAEYATLVDQAMVAGRLDARRADSLLTRATEVLRRHRQVRENYHMIDDELQLPVLVARWITDPRVADADKRAFLLDSSDGGGPRLARLVRELAVVSRMTAAYAASPVTANLIGFARRDSSWASTSWRDSGAGYAGGRCAMDVNAIWAPHALTSLARILETLAALGWSPGDLERVSPGLSTSALGAYLREPARARDAARTWRGAARHFEVTLAPAEVQARVDARLAAMPAEERAHWSRVLVATGAARDTLTFLALSLDAEGRPIGVANTDIATRLFLGDDEEAPPVDSPEVMARVLGDVRLFVRAYPVGLFIDRVGPVVANDAFAAPSTWRAFERDAYHGPRVAWGREVNLFLLGVARHVAAAGDTTADPARRAYVAELRAAATKVTSAVEASGFHSELWSYAFSGGAPTPVRYGSGADVQLWSTTDLAVRYALAMVGGTR